MNLGGSDYCSISPSLNLTICFYRKLSLFYDPGRNRFYHTPAFGNSKFFLEIERNKEIERQRRGKRKRKRDRKTKRDKKEKKNTKKREKQIKKMIYLNLYALC